MKIAPISAAIWIAVAAAGSASGPGSADDFLTRAERLKAKGPLAFFDSDYGRLKTEATAVGKAIGDDATAARRAGKPTPYCSPAPRAELGSFEFIHGLEAIPAGERARMSLKDAMIRVLAVKYPCHH